MLTRTPGAMFRTVRKAVNLIRRKQPDSSWVDDVTPAWVSDGLLHHTAGNVLLDASGAFDDPTGD